MARVGGDPAQPARIPSPFVGGQPSGIRPLRSRDPVTVQRGPGTQPVVAVGVDGPIPHPGSRLATVDVPAPETPVTKHESTPHRPTLCRHAREGRGGRGSAHTGTGRRSPGPQTRVNRPRRKSVRVPAHLYLVLRSSTAGFRLAPVVLNHQVLGRLLTPGLLEETSDTFLRGVAEFDCSSRKLLLASGRRTASQLAGSAAAATCASTSGSTMAQRRMSSVMITATSCPCVAPAQGDRSDPRGARAFRNIRAATAPVTRTGIRTATPVPAPPPTGGRYRSWPPVPVPPSQARGVRRRTDPAVADRPPRSTGTRGTRDAGRRAARTAHHPGCHAHWSAQTVTSTTVRQSRPADTVQLCAARRQSSSTATRRA
jgi:hypothetical protein